MQPVHKIVRIPRNTFPNFYFSNIHIQLRNPYCQDPVFLMYDKLGVPYCQVELVYPML